MPVFSPSTVAWVPIVDISRHQGRVDFVKMRAAGVEGLIQRISHGLVLDSMADEYWAGAIAAGYEPSEIGHYPFINPKRGTARATAMFALEHIERERGDLDCIYMLDVESYINESPNIGSAPFFGERFADYIREHIDVVHHEAPLARVIGYTNRAFWNGPIAKGSQIQWVGDAQLASELDWIVARFPVNSLLGYLLRPLPDTPDQWDEWAFARAPDGPYPPIGADGWRGWQLSAGYNRQGKRYGASSSDLDLNIVHPEAWARWTRQTQPAPVPTPQPIPPMEADMSYVIFDLVDSKATHWGTTNRVGGPVLSVRWSGEGSQNWLARRAQMEAEPTTEVRTASVGNLITMDLEGALPTGDPDHVWTGDEYANAAELRDRDKPVAAEDQVARDGVQFCRDELEARAQRDDKLYDAQRAAWAD